MNTPLARGCNLLHVAAAMGDVAAVQVREVRRGSAGCLLAFDIIRAFDHCGKHALLIDYQMLLQLGAEVDASDSSGNTALHAAVLEDRVECVQALVRSGASVLARVCVEPLSNYNYNSNNALLLR